MPDNSNTVQITLSVKDDGSIVIEQAKGKIQGLGDTSQAVASKSSSALAGLKENWVALAAGVTAGYFAIKKSIDLLDNFVSKAAEAEQIESRMAFQIEATGIQYDKVNKAIGAYADVIQKTTRFSSEAVKEGLAQMMTYTNDLTEGLNNTKLAMDIATQKNFDLNTAVRLVGIAMNGDVEIMAKWIHQLKNLNSILGDDATATEKWAYTQKLLNGMFGGASQKDLSTYLGSLTQVKSEISDLEKAIGEKLLPKYKDLLGTIKLLGENVFPDEQMALRLEQVHWEELIESLETAGVEYSHGLPEAIEKLNAVKAKLEVFQKKEIDNNAALLATEQARANQERRGYEEITRYATKEMELSTALNILKMESTQATVGEVEKQLWALEKLKEGWNKNAGATRDYVNALRAVAENMKKLTGEDLAAQREEAWDKNAEAIKNISKDEEGWLKKVNKANDELFKTLKDLDKLKIPTHADVAPMEREVNAMKERLRAEGLVIPVRTEQATGGGMEITPSLTSPTGGVQINAPQGWSPVTLEEWKDFVKGGSQGGGYSVDIGIFGIGSTRKPITEKIKEIIDEFGGLDKAMSGMEAEINLAGMSAEYQKLNNQLKRVERIMPDLANVISWGGGNWFTGGPSTEYQQQITLQIQDLKSQLSILRMKMQYEALQAYGGSMQTGGIVPFTGLYQLHEGEKVVSRNQISMGGITNIFQIKSTDPRQTADEIAKVLKYHLHGELRDLLRR